MFLMKGRRAEGKNVVGWMDLGKAKYVGFPAAAAAAAAADDDDDAVPAESAAWVHFQHAK
jgi:hypothetical protein